MSNIMRVKPWGEGQGDFVEINAEDFDPSFHKPLNEVADDPLDHDGDGKAGGSVSGYHATAAKGARRRKGKSK